jgi:hypothetical protein
MHGVFSGRYDDDLRSQILKTPNVPTLSDAERSEFTHAVQEFAAHLRSLSSELTETSITYINLLECLALTA